jgi:hypothetical protein
VKLASLLLPSIADREWRLTRTVTMFHENRRLSRSSRLTLRSLAHKPLDSMTCTEKRTKIPAWVPYSTGRSPPELQVPWRTITQRGRSQIRARCTPRGEVHDANVELSSKIVLQNNRSAGHALPDWDLSGRGRVVRISRSGTIDLRSATMGGLVRFCCYGT